MPVLRSALLSAGTPGYGVLLTMVEHLGLYTVLEQATTPDQIRDPRLLSEGSDLRAATAAFEARRAASAARAPELPRSAQVLRYVAAMEAATTPLVPVPARAPVTLLSPHAASPATPAMHVPPIAEPLIASEPPVVVTPPPTVPRLRRGTRRRSVVQEPLAIAEIVAYAPLDEPVEPSSEADWIALTPRSAATVTPPAHTPSVPEEVPSLDTSTSPHTTPPPAVTAPTPRLSVDEIIARAFGRRPAPELPTVEPGPAPERVSRALIAERLAHGAYASAPALDDIAEIEIDRAGTVTVRRGPAERLPAYLPAMAGVHAVVGFLGEQIVVHDLLRVDDRDLRGEPLWRRYVTAMECSSVAGIPVVPLLPHPRPVDAAERISVRDLRAPYGRSGSWISAD